MILFDKLNRFSVNELRCGVNISFCNCASLQNCNQNNEIMDTDLINTNDKPSEVDDSKWIYCVDEDIYEEVHSNYDDPDLDGKWMMFFKKGEEMDGKWKEACDLYRQRKLDGITSMKVSTAIDDPIRTSDTRNSVICFYCGPADDEAKLMTYGKNLLKNIPYNSTFLRYKSDKQTRAGTFATGQKINSMYKINVSDIDSPACSNAHGSSNRQWHAPSNRYDSSPSSNQNWRDRKRPEETNWRSGNRNQRSSNFHSNPRETNWRQQSQDQVSHFGATSVASNQNWRRNDVAISNDNASDTIHPVDSK